MADVYSITKLTFTTFDFPEEEPLILVDQDGEEYEFLEIAKLEFDGKIYKVLTTWDEYFSDGEELVIAILLVEHDEDGEEILVEIGDGDEWNEVADILEKLEY
ncbi:MAG: DUF1292 domain-containing protein [Ignavibacteriales bacterium]